MIYLLMYCMIGVIFGCVIYLIAYAIDKWGKPKDDVHDVLDLLIYISEHPVLYTIASAFMWPLFIKWIIFG